MRSYVHMEFCLRILGEFGIVYKGIWTHQNATTEEMVSDVVALKSIKSMYVCVYVCLCIYTYVHIYIHITVLLLIDGIKPIPVLRYDDYLQYQIPFGLLIKFLVA